MQDTFHTIKVTDFATTLQDQDTLRLPQANQTLPSLSYNNIIDGKVKERSTNALNLFQLGDFEAAKREYRKLIFLSPKTSDFHVKYADALAQTNEIQQALVHYKKAQSISNDGSINQKIYELMLKKGHGMLSQNQFSTFVETSIPTVDTEIEIESNRNLPSLSPKLEDIDKTQAYFVRALAYLSENKKGKAIEELNKCTSSDSKNIYAYILKAKIYWNLNQVKKGYHEFWKAFEINAEHPEVKEFLKLVKEKIKRFYDQAIKYFWENDHEKSIFFINKGMEIEPKSIKLLLLRSLIYRKEKKFDMALKDIEQASHSLKEFPEMEEEIKKNLAVTYNEMGIQMMSREDYRNAISLFDEALKFKHNDWGILANKGDCCLKMKNYEAAKDHYNQAYTLNPKQPALNTRLGLCCFQVCLEYYQSKKYYKCIQLIDEALNWDPKNTEYMCMKGKLCLLLNDPKKAFQSYKAATLVNPHHKEALQYLAQFPADLNRGDRIVLERVSHKSSYTSK